MDVAVATATMDSAVADSFSPWQMQQVLSQRQKT